jgi:hypothetical protein
LNEIIAAAIGASAVILTAVGGYFVRLREMNLRKAAEAELRIQRAALGFSDFVQEWNAITADLDFLLNETAIDRFLILRAWNGRLDPRWTTAVFQYRKGRQQPVNYVHFELDIDYVSRLREIGNRNLIHFNVIDLPESAIKSVYLAEGVKAAAWFHLHTYNLTDSDSAAITYCSFATHEDEGINDATLIRCKLIVDRLKSIAVFHGERIENELAGNKQ